MTRDAFKKIVTDTVTEGLRVPTAPNTTAFNTLIDNALRWFKQNDDNSTEHEYIVLSSKNFTTPLFKAKRQVKLPSCVEAITALQDPGSRFSFGQIAGSNRGDTGFNRAMMISGNSDNMLYAVVANAYQDFIRQNFVLVTVAYDYNPFSKMLTIKGRDPSSDLIASAEVHLCEEDIFENDRFHRYVIGQVRQSFARIYGIVKVKTIGGLDINVSSFSTEGKDAVKEVKDEIIGDRSADFMEFF